MCFKQLQDRWCVFIPHFFSYEFLFLDSGLFFITEVSLWWSHLMKGLYFFYLLCSITFCIPESFDTNIYYQFFVYKIIFVNSQQAHTNSKVYLYQKDSFICWFKDFVIQIQSDSGLVWRIQLI